jgi:hypothetical protein
MKSVNEFLDAVKEKTGSDYQTAIMLGHDRQIVSGWRRFVSFPTVTQISRMCEVAGIDLDKAIFAVEASREEKQGSGDYWKKKLAALGGTAASVAVLIVTLIVTGGVPAPAQAAPMLALILQKTNVYIIRSIRYLLGPSKGRLSCFSKFLKMASALVFRGLQK